MPKVLVIEGYRPLKEILCKTFREADWNVLTSNDVEGIRRKIPHVFLVVTSLSVPGISFREIKELCEKSKTHLILQTGSQEEACYPYRLEKPYNRLEKPYTQKELWAVVNKVLGPERKYRVA